MTEKYFIAKTYYINKRNINQLKVITEYVPNINVGT